MEIDPYSKVIEFCKTNDVIQLKKWIGRIQSTDERSKEGWTLLMVAAFYNSKEVAKLLIENGANVNATNYKGTSVLMYAKDGAINNANDTELLLLLIDYGASISLKDSNVLTVLDYVKNQNTAIYNFLKSR